MPTKKASSKKASKKDQYLNAIKQGGVKEGIDISIRKISAPLTKMITPLLGSRIDEDISDPVVRAGVELAVMQLCAEVFAASKGVVHKIPGTKLTPSAGAKKMEAVSRFMQVYSSEKFSEEAAAYAVTYLPLIKGMVSDFGGGLFSSEEDIEGIKSLTDSME